MSNLPPGCTMADIDRACGADLPALCGAQSPDGKFACTVNLEACELDENERHIGAHECAQEVAVYSREPECSNPNHPDPDPEGYPCDHQFHPGTWFDGSAWGGSGEYVTVARWPHRDDDFDVEGNPTQRNRATAAEGAATK